jgi:hypothetical protein
MKGDNSEWASITTCKNINSILQRTSCGANVRCTAQDYLHPLCNLKIHFSFHNNRLLVPALSHLNPPTILSLFLQHVFFHSRLSDRNCKCISIYDVSANVHTSAHQKVALKISSPVYGSVTYKTGFGLLNRFIDCTFTVYTPSLSNTIIHNLMSVDINFIVINLITNIDTFNNSC